MKTAFYPGSFDPFHFGHLYVLEETLKMFEHVTVGIMRNEGKNPTFNDEERKGLIVKALDKIGYKDRYSIIVSDELTVDRAALSGAGCIVRGVRLMTDYDSELNFAMNIKLFTELPVVWIPPKQQFLHISSTAVRSYYFRSEFKKLEKYVPKRELMYLKEIKLLREDIIK